MSLDFDGVTFEYASGTPLAHTALVNVTTAFERGRITLIAGVTGSGKSTLLSLAAGLLMPQEGTVSCDGKAIRAGDVGFVMQHPHRQLFEQTVEDDVAFGLLNQGVDAKRAHAQAREMLVRVGLDPDEIGMRSPFELSGGQAKRVVLAGVLALDRTFLLLDEPSAGLDGNGRRFVEELIIRLADEGHGVVVVSHDLDEFLPCAERLLLLRGGQVVFCGDIDDAVERPNTFARACLEVPAVLRFEEHLGCARGCYSLDTEIAAHWALAHAPVGGPALPSGAGTHTEGGRGSCGALHTGQDDR